MVTDSKGHDHRGDPICIYLRIM